MTQEQMAKKIIELEGRLNLLYNEHCELRTYCTGLTEQLKRGGHRVDVIPAKTIIL